MATKIKTKPKTSQEVPLEGPDPNLPGPYRPDETRSGDPLQAK